MENEKKGKTKNEKRKLKNKKLKTKNQEPKIKNLKQNLENKEIKTNYFKNKKGIIIDKKQKMETEN